MRAALSLFLVALSLALSSNVKAQVNAERGAALYELRCGECHDTKLHQRSRPAARSYQDVRGWVTHWSTLLGYQWEQADIDAVARYLNTRFYSYPCYGDNC